MEYVLEYQWNMSINEHYLVGGLEHLDYFSIICGKNHPNWRTHIFQRGWNHQVDLFIILQMVDTTYEWKLI